MPKREQIADGVDLYLGDCRDVLPTLDADSVDAVVTDPPYGTTACSWDSVIPFDFMWKQLRRISKERAAIVLTCSQPFTSALIMSNVKEFKYCWVWDKKKSGSPLLSKVQPLRVTEDVAVFGAGMVTYNPEMVRRDKPVRRRGNRGAVSETTGNAFVADKVYTHRYPKNILTISNAYQNNRVHPTQKPVALMEYLIRTYTNEGDTVLDFTMGSGTTGVACVKMSRRFIGIEMEQLHFDTACKRIAAEVRRQKSALPFAPKVASD